MFGLGFGEILVLAAIGLMVLGPKQLPQVARVLGKTIGELRKAMREVTSSLAMTDEEKPPASTATTTTTTTGPTPAPVVTETITPDPSQGFVMPPIKKDKS